jgi:NAD(P)-dependent dehydrogenase (short-subunit alcohol dehydrogenase family)
MGNKPFMDFEGKKVVVTGASSGIGRAISIELSQHGAGLILIGRNQERLEETAAGLSKGDHKTISLDLTNHSEIVPTIREFARQAGRIYGLCHCAGIVETRPLSSYKVEGLSAMLNVNLIAGIELARAISRRDVMEPDGGSILLMSSIYGRVGMPGQIGYAGSKGAVVAAARAMAIELARRNIRVNTLSPGFVKTPMTDDALAKLSEKQVKKIEDAHPLGTGTPEDVARAAAFLLAPQNRWITGVDLVIDGGYTAQ